MMLKLISWYRKLKGISSRRSVKKTNPEGNESREQESPSSVLSLQMDLLEFTHLHLLVLYAMQHQRTRAGDYSSVLDAKESGDVNKYFILGFLIACSLKYR